MLNWFSTQLGSSVIGESDNVFAILGLHTKHLENTTKTDNATASCPNEKTHKNNAITLKTKKNRKHFDFSPMQGLCKLQE